MVHLGAQRLHKLRLSVLARPDRTPEVSGTLGAEPGFGDTRASIEGSEQPPEAAERFAVLRVHRLILMPPRRPTRYSGSRRVNRNDLHNH